jgi:hypothetical protein
MELVEMVPVVMVLVQGLVVMELVVEEQAGMVQVLGDLEVLVVVERVLVDLEDLVVAVVAVDRVDLPDRPALMCPASRLGTIHPILPMLLQLVQAGRMMHNSIISVRMLKPRAVGMPTREETCNGKEVEYRYRAA